MWHRFTVKLLLSHGPSHNNVPMLTCSLQKYDVLWMWLVYTPTPLKFNIEHQRLFQKWEGGIGGTYKLMSLTGFLQVLLVEFKLNCKVGR